MGLGAKAVWARNVIQVFHVSGRDSIAGVIITASTGRCSQELEVRYKLGTRM